MSSGSKSTVVRPNLFIVGAMKSGTTSLHNYLHEHPQVFMSDIKEPSFFCTPEQLLAIGSQAVHFGFWKNEDRYLDLFSAGAGADWVGESSTNYTKLPKVDGVVERIAEFSPGARFIYLLRDPVKRTISHYWHAFRNEGEKRPLMRALVEDPHYREVSDYAMQWRAYAEVFGPERVLVVTTEELEADPGRLMRTIFAWLGVDADFVPLHLDARHNETSEVIYTTRSRLLPDSVWNSSVFFRLRRAVPSGMNQRIKRLLARPQRRADVPSDEAVAYLRPLLAPKVAELSAAVGRGFPEWTAVAAAKDRTRSTVE